MAVSKRLRYEILRRDNHTCRYCGATAPGVPLRVDHVIPVALGGTDDPANLVSACEPCNSGKSSSAPDASLIASASDDQLRWSLAMKQAVEAAAVKRSEMDDYRAAFRNQWDQWTSGGKPFELPDDWTITMDRFHNSGLPAFMWDDIVTKTMVAKYVDDPFKYACGIAWKEVTALQDAARQALTRADSTREDDADESWSLLGELLPCVGQERYESALSHLHLDVEEVYDKADIKERAATMAVWDLMAEAERLERVLCRLLGLFPATEIAELQNKAERLERNWVKQDQPIRSTLLWAGIAEQLLSARADAATSAMADEELAEWMQYAESVFNGSKMWKQWGGDSEDGRRRRAGEMALLARQGWHHEGLCHMPGRLIPTCPRQTKARVHLPGCEECGISPTPADGMDVCAEHFEQFATTPICKHHAPLTEGSHA